MKTKRIKNQRTTKRRRRLRTTTHCIACGVAIAEQLFEQGLCCSCRYRREFVSEDQAEQGEEQATDE
jgi:hypothetical protein